MFTCKMSVRSLVESIYQSGDLIASSSSIERANLGSRIHRQIQVNASGDHSCEVLLKNTTEIGNIRFVIEGRADCIYKDGDTITIEEIKTTALPYKDINDTHFVHFAQAYCYGYFYMVEHEINKVTIQLSYYQIETHQIKSFEQSKTFEELDAFYQESLQHYKRWADLTNDLQHRAQSSLQELKFPFPNYREGQRRFAVAVYKTILDEDVLFAQAPTGIGKTISTLFPALKAIGEGKADKIFYLCAKNINANVAYNTIQTIYASGVSFKTVGISAKDKVCFLEKRNCDPEECPYAKGYYDRCGDALYEALHASDFLVQDTLANIAKAHRVCPFELSLDASLYADVIVADYNYVFDPRVYLKRFFMEKGNYIFLVDEAHNLVERAKEMYSSSIQKSAFLHCKALLPKSNTALLRSLNKINKEFLRLRKQCEQEKQTFLSQKEPMPLLHQYLTTFIEHMDAYLQSEHNEEMDDELRDVYFTAINYNKIADFYDEHFRTCVQLQDKDVLVKQFCMNPCNPLKERIQKGKATIFFSATLSPIEYYLSLMGGNEHSKRLSLPSPFPVSHLHVMLANQISTRYRMRDASLSSISEMIYACSNAAKGNYIIFAPSYVYMKKIVEQFQNDYPNIPIVQQEGDMNEIQKQEFLKRFEKTKERCLYFCVIGGMFSEGIDLKGDKLIGAIIVGVGLPQINPWQDLIRNHFDENNHKGYAYAYQYPGMNKVLQSAGRVIRSSQDYGVLLFIDERYTSNAYKNTFPAHLRHYQIVHNAQDVANSCTMFWKRNKQK